MRERASATRIVCSWAGAAGGAIRERPAARSARPMLMSPPAVPGSAAARKRAVLLLQLERPELLDRRVDVARIHQALGGKLRRGELVLHVPGLDVEHAGGVHAAIRAARRPRVLVQELRAPLGAAGHQPVDAGGARAAPGAGLA